MSSKTLPSLNAGLPHRLQSLAFSIGDSHWPALAIIVVASVFSVLFHGFEFPYNNNIFHIPIALDVFNSTEGPHDALHQSFGNFVSGFWQLVRLLTTEDNIYGIFFALHLATRFAMLTLLWLIVRRVSLRTSPALAFVVALPFFVGLLGSISPLGHHELFVNYLTHSEVATIFVLLAWLLQSHRRWIWAAAALGIGFNINAFVAVWAAIPLWIAMLLVEQDSLLPNRLRTTLVMGLTFLVAAAPTAIWIVRSQLIDVPAVDVPAAYDFREFLLAYFPFHTFIHVQPERVGCFAVLAGTCALLVVDMRSLYDTTVSRTWLGTFIGLFLVVALGMVLPYLTGSRLLLNLYPLRMDAFIEFLTVVLLCGQLTSREENNTYSKALLLIALFSFTNGNLWLLFVTIAAALKTTHAHSRLWSILTAGVLAALIIHGFAFGVAPVLREELKFGQAIAAAIISGGIAGFALRGRRYFDPLLPAIVVAIAAGVADEVGALPLSISYLATALTVLRAQSQTKGELVVLWLLNGCALVLLAACSTISTTHALCWVPIGCAVSAAVAARMLPTLIPRVQWSRWGEAMPPAVFAMVVSVGVGVYVAIKGTAARTGHNEESIALLEVAQWARHNTPPDTVFLTPRISEGFYVFARRPIWVEWKSGAAAMWQPGYYAEWSSRSAEVARLTDAATWVAYANKKHIPYVVLDLKKDSAAAIANLSFKIRNRYFGIVQIESAR